MQACFSSNGPEYLLIPCTIIVHNEDQLGAGTIWGFFPIAAISRVSALSSGMTVSLSLHLPGNARVKLEYGLVTWGKSIRVWLSLHPGPRPPLLQKEHHMSALVWPTIIGLLVGLAVATFVVYRVQPQQLHTARTTPMDTFEGYLLDRPSRR